MAEDGPSSRARARAPRPRCFAEALHAAVLTSGLTLDRVADRLARRGLRVSTTTLSNWQRGETTPTRAASLRAVSVLEDILALGEGELTGLLGRPATSLRKEAQPPRIGSPPDLCRCGTRQLQDTLEFLSIQVTHVVDGLGMSRLETHRQVVRAADGAVDGCCLPLFDHTSSADVEPRSGCRLAAATSGGSTTCFEIAFDAPVEAGDTHLFEVATRWRSEAAQARARTRRVGEVRRALRAPADQLLFRVVFDPARRPDAISACVWESPGADPVVVGRMRVDDSGTAHHLVLDPRPGIYGARWSWDSS